jgi:cytochrome c biogenesis protein CcmG, thiol:disulfide interchange protein DsbE
VRRFRSAPALVLIVLLAGCYSGSRPRHIGQPAADFTVQDSDRTVGLNQFRGQVVVLNFWATWCPPCVEELPSLMNMQSRMKGSGVVVLAISVDVDGNAYHRFLKEHDVSLLTVRDPDEKVSRIYGTSGWPETFIIDRQGIVRRKFVGPVDWTSPEVMQFLSKL